MIVDTVRSSGFDPTLLNPLPPTENVFGTSRTSRTGSPAINQPAPTTTMNAATSSSSMPAPSVYNPLVQPVSYLEFDISSILPLATSTSINPFLVPPQATDHTHGHGSSRMPSPRPYTSLCRTKTPEIIPITAPTSSASSALIIERPPTPLPEFHVDKTLLRELQQLLVKTTASLNIEQLEQLRATCLGSVWRHRMDWERDEVVRELMEQVKEFVEEVTELDSDGDLWIICMSMRVCKLPYWSPWRVFFLVGFSELFIVIYKTFIKCSQFSNTISRCRRPTTWRKTKYYIITALLKDCIISCIPNHSPRSKPKDYMCSIVIQLEYNHGPWFTVHPYRIQISAFVLCLISLNLFQRLQTDLKTIIVVRLVTVLDSGVDSERKLFESVATQIYYPTWKASFSMREHQR